MKFKIEKAYDSVHLSEASKERILEELMDSQKPGFRTHQKAAPGPKWRAIPVALILIIVIAVGGFLGIKALGGRDMQSVATEPSDPTDHLYLKDDIIVTDTKEPFDYERFYADVPEYLRDHVILYDQAISENWPQEEWDRIGLSLELYKVKDRVSCGFIVRDLDGDGLEDLLIYGGTQLYDILVVEYWPENLDLGLPAYSLHSLNQEENGACMSLCEDNVIMLTYVRNDRDSCVSYNRVVKSEEGVAMLDPMKTVIAIDGTEWFAGPTEDEVVPISGEEAETIKAGYTALPVDPKAFSHLRAYLVTYQHQFDGVDERYKPLLMTYGQALCEDWSQVRWEEAGLSPYIYLFKEEVAFRYTLLDLDGNGEDELLIFGGNHLYALYVLRDDQPIERLQWKIHHNAVPVGMQLCEGNIVKIPQSEIAGSNYVSFYRLGKDGLGETDLVMVDTAFQTTDGQWYAGPNAKDAVAVTESEAQALIASYVPVEIEGIPMLNKVRIE